MPDLKKEFLSKILVSHETFTQLERYAELLVEWNEKFNLVAPSTLPLLWQRHFLDSAQLFTLLPPGARVLVDLGSGAGFPGLVLAIMGVPEVHLIESIGKKANFLCAVANDLKLGNVTIHQARIEKIRGLAADVVTARALKPLPELLSLTKPLLKKDALALFLKGQNADAELTEAAKYWTFSFAKLPSLSDPSGVVLKVSDVKVNRHHGFSRRKKN